MNIELFCCLCSSNIANGGGCCWYVRGRVCSCAFFVGWLCVLEEKVEMRVCWTGEERFSIF